MGASCTALEPQKQQDKHDGVRQQHRRDGVNLRCDPELQQRIDMDRKRRIPDTCGEESDNKVVYRERERQQRTTDNTGSDQGKRDPPKRLPLIRPEVTRCLL